MELSSKIVKTLNEMDSDYARLILKMNDYIKENDTLLNIAQEQIININKVQFSEEEGTFFLIFSHSEQLMEKKSAQINHIHWMKQSKFMQSQDSVNNEKYYYSGKKLNERLSMKYLSDELEHQIANAKKLKIYLSLSEISSYPIWQTKMRRKMLAVLSEVEGLDSCHLSDKDLLKILQKTELIPLKEDKYYELDYVAMVIKRCFELVKDTSNIELRYIGNDELSQEECFLVNEFSKFERVLRSEKDRLNIIYDIVCDDLDNMFSSFGFCDFQKNQCISQRHKDLFENRYPVPTKDGCCFNVFRKCTFLKNGGGCNTKCIACKLFTCPYLAKLGIGVMASEVLLIRAFFNDKQKKDAVYRFFQPEEAVIKHLESHKNKL